VVPDVSGGFGRANPGAAGNMRTTWYDTMTTLAFLAASTQRVRLLTYVLVPAYRHPLLVAKAAMTLDNLSNGRLILGVGAGHVEKEFEALGVDYSKRGRLLDEAIDALRMSFSEEWTSFSGQTWRWSSLAQSPRPVQPHIPIWIGGSSDAALRRVARRGDGWLPLSTSRAEMPRSIATIRKYAEEAERSTWIDIGFMAEWTYIGTPPWDLGPAPHLTGRPDAIAESLREIGDMGCSHIQVRLRSRTVDELLDQMDLFAAEVSPLLDR
jgi:probable F420-dependent oxidoreductase